MTIKDTSLSASRQTSARSATKYLILSNFLTNDTRHKTEWIRKKLGLSQANTNCIDWLPWLRSSHFGELLLMLFWRNTENILVPCNSSVCQLMKLAPAFGFSDFSFYLQLFSRGPAIVLCQRTQKIIKREKAK